MNEDIRGNPPPSPLKHSRAGIASFVIGFLLILVLLSGYVTNLNLENYIDDIVSILVALTSAGLIGLAVGLYGISQPNKKKIFSLFGILFCLITSTYFAYAFLSIFAD